MDIFNHFLNLKFLYFFFSLSLLTTSTLGEDFLGWVERSFSSEKVCVYIALSIVIIAISLSLFSTPSLLLSRVCVTLYLDWSGGESHKIAVSQSTHPCEIVISLFRPLLSPSGILSEKKNPAASHSHPLLPPLLLAGHSSNILPKSRPATTKFFSQA